MIELDKNELAKMGVHFGSLVRYKHPQMNKFIHNRRKGKYVLDLNEVIIGCQKAEEYIAKLINEKKKILFLCTKKNTRQIIKDQAEKCNMPYINYKWKGGLLTNFEEIKKKLKELQGLKFFIQKDSFKQLVKKEQKKIEQRYERLKKVYDGITNLWNLPQAIFVIGLNKEKVACREAQKLNIPIISICNVNCNPNFVDLIIPGNDVSLKSIDFFANFISDTINNSIIVTTDSAQEEMTNK